MPKTLKPQIVKKPLKNALVEIPLPPTHKISLPPDTTAEQDIVTAGQRKINQIWEWTQCFIACVSTIVMLFLGAYLAIQGRIADFPPFMALSYGVILGCYYQRTNHTKVGGVGVKHANEER